MSGAGRAYFVAAPVISCLILVLLLASYLISGLLVLPFSLDFNLAVRAAGAVVLAAGITLAGWVFATRNPATVLASTYVTLLKLARRVPLAESTGRVEPLVVGGPQKYSRNPLYLGVVIILLGWGLLTAISFVLVMTVVMLLWFRLVLIPFEEKELLALFGDQYKEYAESVPMLVPFTKRRERPPHP